MAIFDQNGNELQVLNPRRYADEHDKTLPQCYEKYIALRIEGVARAEAVIRAFLLIRLGASLHNAYEVALAVEQSDYFMENWPVRLAAAKTGDMWNEKKAVHRLLCMAEDSSIRDGVRLNAIVQLNVLMGIVVTENGMTMRNKAHSIEDFERMERATRELENQTVH